MSEFDVESGVEAPPPQSNRRYPWPDMEAGDSFLIPTEDGRDPASDYRAAQPAGQKWCARNRPDLKCTGRRVDGGVRIWLVRREDS